MLNRSGSIISLDDLTQKPLDSQNRAVFDCEDEAVNGYIHSERILRDIKNRETAAYVLVTPEDEIAAYYTLANSSINRATFANSEKKRLDLCYPSTPATLIGYLGVDKGFKRQGIGRYAVRRALEKCLELSEACGSAVVWLEVETKNAIAKAMYSGAAFREFPPAEDFESLDTDPPRYVLDTMYIAMRRIPDALALLAKK